MREVKPINIEKLNTYALPDEKEIEKLLAEQLKKLNRKIVVLDDDPTGVQTVHDISVYTDWEKESIKQGFEEENSMFFILTNSRGFTVPRTEQAHKEIAQNIVSVSKETKKDFIVICRGDSTMRGHYPLEPETIRTTIENNTSKRFDGEIIYPFFKEGGRYTIDNIHYVKEGNFLVPAGMTEFAKDKTFGYQSSHLGDWCEEKSKGSYQAENMIYISLEDLRSCNIEKIKNQLLTASNFQKIIVNSIDYIDVKVFTIAFIQAALEGKEFLFRSAAAITKILGGVSDKPLLTKKELVSPENKHGGIVLIGSHVKKTTMQLEELKQSAKEIHFIEFHANAVLEKGGLEKEVEQVIGLVEKDIENGKTVAVYTSRKLVTPDTQDKDKILEASIEISNAVTSIIGKLNIRPSFIIAKGGITSSDVGTKALKVKRALVMGQIKPGIPVWLTGKESKFPNMPYVIFPGNVGETTTLKEAVEILMD